MQRGARIASARATGLRKQDAHCLLGRVIKQLSGHKGVRGRGVFYLVEDFFSPFNNDSHGLWRRRSHGAQEREAV